jgi:macrolide-specific efflux system membrane fusion protein
MTRQIRWVILAGIWLLIVGCSGRPEKKPIEAAIQRQTILRHVYGIGTLTAEKSFGVKVGVTSRVASLNVSEGQSVKKGGRLVLFDNGAQVDSPIDGVVTLVAVKLGELAYPQVPIIQVTDLSRLYVQVGLEQQAASQVRPKMIARLSFEGSRGRAIEGRVTNVYPNDGQFFARIEVPLVPEGLLPGMTLDVAVEVDRKDGVFVVAGNLIHDQALSIQRDGKVKEVPVKIGLVDGNRVEVISNELREGDLPIEWRGR